MRMKEWEVEREIYNLPKAFNHFTCVPTANSTMQAFLTKTKSFQSNPIVLFYLEST